MLSSVDGRAAISGKVALLVDGSGIEAEAAPAIVSYAERMGAVIIRRVYCDAGMRSGWDGRHGFSVVHAGSAWHSPVAPMAMDAVELALGGRVSAFAIATAGRDHSALALRLREYGFGVIGIGTRKTPAIFRDACASFVVLSGVQVFTRLRRATAPTEAASALAEIETALEASGVGRRWVTLAWLEALLEERAHATLGGLLGSDRFGRLLEESGLFEMSLDEGGEPRLRRLRIAEGS